MLKINNFYYHFQVMRLCWASNPDDRPPFRQMKEELVEIAQNLHIDWEYIFSVINKITKYIKPIYISIYSLVITETGYLICAVGSSQCCSIKFELKGEYHKLCQLIKVPTCTRCKQIVALSAYKNEGFKKNKIKKCFGCRKIL